jgi:hypothetical protein
MAAAATRYGRWPGNEEIAPILLSRPPWQRVEGLRPAAEGRPMRVMEGERLLRDT